MSLVISISISGDKEIQRKLKRLGSGINNMPEAMIKIGKYAVEYYSTIGISDKGRPWGQVWRELNPTYQAQKEKKWPGRPPMIAEGTLQKGFYARHTDSQVTIGNHAKHYPFHQSSATRHKLPRRQIAGINNPIKRRIAEIIKEDIGKKLKVA